MVINKRYYFGIPQYCVCYFFRISNGVFKIMDFTARKKNWGEGGRIPFLNEIFILFLNSSVYLS